MFIVLHRQQSLVYLVKATDAVRNPVILGIALRLLPSERFYCWLGWSLDHPHC
jgi:hypothetical protein